MKGAGYFSVIPKSLAQWMHRHIFDEATWMMLLFATQKHPRFKNSNWFFSAINNNYDEIILWAQMYNIAFLDKACLKQACLTGPIHRYLTRLDLIDVELIEMIGAGAIVENMDFIVRWMDAIQRVMSIYNIQDLHRMFVKGVLENNSNDIEKVKRVLDYTRVSGVRYHNLIYIDNTNVIDLLLERKLVPPIAFNVFYINEWNIRDERVTLRTLQYLLSKGVRWGEFPDDESFMKVSAEKFEWLLQHGKIHLPIEYYFGTPHFKVYLKYATLDPAKVNVFDLNKYMLEHLVKDYNFWSLDCARRYLNDGEVDMLKPVEGSKLEDFVLFLNLDHSQESHYRQLRKLFPNVRKTVIEQFLRQKKRRR